MFQAKKKATQRRTTKVAHLLSMEFPKPTPIYLCIIHYLLYDDNGDDDDERTASWLDLLIFIIVDILIRSLSASQA